MPTSVPRTYIHTHTQTFSLKVKLHKLRFLRIDDVLLIVVAS